MSALERRQIVLLSVVLACCLGFTGCWGASAADVLPPPVPLHSGLVYLLVWMIDTPENVRRRAFLRTHYATQGLERYGFRLFFGASKFERRLNPSSKNATSSTAAAMEVVRQHLPPAEQQPVLLAPHRHPDEEDFLLLDPYWNGCNRKKHCFPTMQLQWWDFVLHESERLKTSTTTVPNETTIIAAVKIEEDSYVDLKTLRTLVDKAEADGHGQWMLGLPLIPYFWDPVGLLEKPTRRRLMPRQDCVWDVHRPFRGNIPDHKNADLDLMLKELLFPAPSSAGGVGGLQVYNSGSRYQEQPQVEALFLKRVIREVLLQNLQPGSSAGSSLAISQRSRTEYQATSTATAADAYYAKRFSAQIRQLFLSFSKAYACYSTPQGGLQGFSTGVIEVLLRDLLPAGSFARMVVVVALGELAEEPLFGFLFWLAVAGRRKEIMFQPVVAPSTFVHSKMVSVDAAGFDHDRYRTQALEHKVEAGVVVAEREEEEEPRIEFCVPFSLGDVEDGGGAQVLLQKVAAAIRRTTEEHESRANSIKPSWIKNRFVGKWLPPRVEYFGHDLPRTAGLPGGNNWSKIRKRKTNTPLRVMLTRDPLLRFVSALARNWAKIKNRLRGDHHKICGLVRSTFQEVFEYSGLSSSNIRALQASNRADFLSQGTVCDVDGSPGSFDLFLDFDAAIAEVQLKSDDDRLLFYDRNHTRSTTSTSTEASSSSLAHLVKQCLPRAAFAPQRIVDAFYKKDMLLYHWGVEQAKVLFHGHFSREQELLPGRVFKNGHYGSNFSLSTSALAEVTVTGKIKQEVGDHDQSRTRIKRFHKSRGRIEVNTGGDNIEGNGDRKREVPEVKVDDRFWNQLPFWELDPAAGNGRPPVPDLTTDSDRVTTFFGFYYPSPWKTTDNKNDSLVLSHVGRHLELHKMRKEPPFGEEEIPFYRKLELRVYKFRPSASATGVRRHGSEDESSGEQNEDHPRESLLLGRSSAWSFPLGARLMWVGDEETTSTVGDEEQKHTVIFNIRVGADDDDASASAPRSTSMCGFPAAPAGSSPSPAAAEFASPCYFPNVFRARLVSFTTSQKNNISSHISSTSDLPYPVFAISSDGNFYTSLNYVRLYALTNLGVYGLPVGTETALWEILERNGGERISRNDGIWVLPVEKKITVKSSGNYPRPRISARQVVDYMKQHRLKFADGRTAGDWLEPPSVAGEQGQNCFVWLEQPKFSDRGDRISFFARGKCPQFALDLSNSKLVEKKARASSILSKLQDMRYFDIGAFTLAVEGVGTDGLWYAGSGVPVSHFDFVGDKVKDTVADRRTNLMYCGPSGMHTMADGGSPGVHTMAAENSETQSKSPEKLKKSSNHRSEVIYTTPSNAVPSGYEKWNRKHDLYAGHCTFSRTKTDVGAVQSIEDPTRFILTDTSCSLCVLPCTKDLPRVQPGVAGTTTSQRRLTTKSVVEQEYNHDHNHNHAQYLCHLNHEQARDLAILDRETEILYRLGRLQVNVSTPEPLFVDLHPRFAPGNRFVSFDSAHGDPENGLLHARHYVMDVGRLMDHVFGAMSEGGPMGGGDEEILTQ